MSFCKYCGTQLEDGQVCTCPQAQAEFNQTEYTAPVQPQQPMQPTFDQPTAPAQQPIYQAPVQPEQPMYQPPVQPDQPMYQPPVQPGQPMYQAPAAPTAPAQPGAAQIYFKNLWEIIKGLLKKPVSTGSDFVKNGDTKIAMGLIGMQTLAVALLLLTMGGLIKIGAGNVVGLFFLGAIVTCGMACVLPAGLMLFGKMFKSELSYDKMLRLSGINSVFAVPFVLVGILAALIFSPSSADTLYGLYSALSSIQSFFVWPIVISWLGVVIGNFVSYGVLKEAENVDKDSMPYIMFFNQIALTIIMAIFIKIGFSIFF